MVTDIRDLVGIVTEPPRAATQVAMEELVERAANTLREAEDRAWVRAQRQLNEIRPTTFNQDFAFNALNVPPTLTPNNLGQTNNRGARHRDMDWLVQEAPILGVDTHNLDLLNRPRDVFSTRSRSNVDISLANTNLINGRRRFNLKSYYRERSKAFVKDKKYESGLRGAAATKRILKGKCFTSNLIYEDINLWKVNNETVLVITYDKEEFIDGLFLFFPKEDRNGSFNKTRLLYRRLGISAKRYKQFTIVESDWWVKVLEPGDICKVPYSVLPKWIPIEEVSYKDNSTFLQLPLIPLGLYSDCEKRHRAELERKKKEALELENKKKRQLEEEAKKKIPLKERLKALLNNKKEKPSYAKIKSSGFFNAEKEDLQEFSRNFDFNNTHISQSFFDTNLNQYYYPNFAQTITGTQINGTTTGRTTAGITAATATGFSGATTYLNRPFFNFDTNI